MNFVVYQTFSKRQSADDKSFLPSLAILWIAFFSYTTSVALLFQYLVLPMVPSLHAGLGLLSHDSLSFHQAAQALAETISRDGWSAWAQWPSITPHGNVAVLAALYALFGPNPSSAIPLNACLHATSGVLLILIGGELSCTRAGRLGSVIAACLFVGFPSALNWYAQIHKDGYAILGFLLLLYSGVKIIRLGYFREATNPLFSALLGLSLTAFIRPNNLQLFLILAVGMLVMAVAMFRQINSRFLVQVLFSTMIIFAASVIRPTAHQIESSVRLMEKAPGAVLSITPDIEEILLTWQWTSSSGLPKFADGFAKKLSNIRVFMAAYGVRENAGYMVDLDSMPGNMREFVGYLPRAMIVGVFAPFPDSWFNKLSLARMVGVAETFLWYVIFPGLLWLAWQRRRNPVLWWLLGCALGLLVIESYITVNLGTLHRVRYPFLFVLILLGVIGWAEAVNKYWWNAKKRPGERVLSGSD